MSAERDEGTIGRVNHGWRPKVDADCRLAAEPASIMGPICALLVPVAIVDSSQLR